MGCNGVYQGALNKLEIAQGRKVEAQVLQGIRGLVDKKHICTPRRQGIQQDSRTEDELTKENIEAMNFDVRLRVDCIGEPGELRNPAKI